MVAFLLSAVVASVFAPASESLAESKTDSNDVTGFYVTITNSDDVTLSVDGTPVGQLAAAKDTINVKTNAPLGYKLLISASDTNLSSNNAGNTGVFSASVGTSSNPVTLSPNTWGYSMDEKSLPIPSTDSTWIGITTTPTQISSSTYATNEDGDNYDIYYGINATTSLPTDTYSTTVTYTAIAEGITETSLLMQNYTYAQCSSLSTGSSTTLMDVRNGANYRITKLADGNCWMTQNLRLDGGITLTSADTNLPTGTEITLPENIKEGDPSNATDMQIIRNLPGYDGNLYNWCAATLNSTDCSTTTAAPVQDICPKGWKLTDVSTLFSTYGIGSLSTEQQIATAEAAPLYFTRSGRYYGGAYGYNGQGTRGFYTSNRVSNSLPNSYGFSYGDYYGETLMNRLNGFSLRCVFKGEDITRLTYMQDMTTALCQNTPEGVTTSLLDRRGYGNGGSNKTTRYGVIKARDGNCWMTDSLNLYNVNISYAYSDFTSGSYSLPASSNWNTYHNVMPTAPALHQFTTSGYTDQVAYNWCAAVVLTSACNTTTQQNQSICPKNWTVPLAGDGNKTFGGLWSSYGVTTGGELAAIKSLGFTRYTGLWWFAEQELGQAAHFWTVEPWADNSYGAWQAIQQATSLQGKTSNGYKNYSASIRCVAR